MTTLSSFQGWIDPVCKNELESAYRSPLATSFNLPTSTTGENILGTRDSFITRIEEGIEASISDANTQIRALFTAASIKEAETCMKWKFPDDRTKSSIINILEYYLKSSRLTLTVDKFSFVQEIPSVRGNPIPIEDSPTLKIVLKNWRRLLSEDESRRSEDKNAGSPLGSQVGDDSSGALSQLNFVTQAVLGTQIHETSLNQEILVDKASAHIAQMRNELLALLPQKSIKQDYRRCDENHSVVSAVLKPLSQDRKLEISSRIDTQANMRHGQPPVYPHQPNQINAIDLLRNKHDLSCTSYVSTNMPIYDDEKENSQEITKVRNEEPPRKELSLTRKNPLCFINLLHQTTESNPFEGTKRLSKLNVTILEKQQTCVERNGAWVQQESSGPSTYANIPDGVLAQLEAFVRQQTNHVRAELNFDKRIPPIEVHREAKLSKRTSSSTIEERSEDSGANDENESSRLALISSNLRRGAAVSVGENRSIHDDDSDEEITSWPPSPMYNLNRSPQPEHAEVDDTRSPQTLVEPHLDQPTCVSRSIAYAPFPSSSPGSDDELPLDVPRAIGEEVDETRTEFVTSVDAFRVVPSTLPQHNSVVQVKRTPYQNSRSAQNPGSSIDTEALPRLRGITSPASSDPVIPATFGELYPQEPSILMGNMASPRSSPVSSGLPLQHQTEPNINSSRDDDQHMLGQCLTELEYSQGSADKVTKRISFTATAPSPIAQKGFTRGLSENTSDSERQGEDLSNSIMASRSDVNVASTLSGERSELSGKSSKFKLMSSGHNATARNSIAKSSYLPIKRRKLKTSTSFQFSQEDDYQPVDISEIIRAERYKYKPASDDEVDSVDKDNLSDVGSGLETSKEVPDSTEVSAMSEESILNASNLGYSLNGHPKPQSVVNDASQPRSARAAQHAIACGLASQIPATEIILTADSAGKSHVGESELSSTMNLNVSANITDSLQSIQPTARRSSPRSTAFDVFMDTYPTYTGSRKRFIEALAYLEYLEQGRKKRFLRRSLWDDFIRVLDAEYIDYLRSVRYSDIEKLTGLDFYNDQDEDPVYKEMIITPDNLREALESMDYVDVTRARNKFNRPLRNAAIVLVSESSREGPYTPSHGHQQPHSPDLFNTRLDQIDKPASSRAMCDFGDDTLKHSRKRPFFETYSQLQTAQRAETDSTEEDHDDLGIQVVSAKKSKRTLPWNKNPSSPQTDSRPSSTAPVQPKPKDLRPTSLHTSGFSQSFPQQPKSTVLPKLPQPPTHSAREPARQAGPLPSLSRKSDGSKRTASTISRSPIIGTPSTPISEKAAKPLTAILFARSLYLKRKRESGEILTPDKRRHGS
ncbi:hypothetical protein B0O99DRAFT_687408 [Bisporella sp. PMI_857]|nr:hypothetical protein B0O99DRAFT_687408 [Bisporella sp. PMI_857]